MVIPKDRFGEDRDVVGRRFARRIQQISSSSWLLYLFPYKSASSWTMSCPRGQVHLIHTWLMHRRAWETGPDEKRKRVARHTQR